MFFYYAPLHVCVLLFPLGTHITAPASSGVVVTGGGGASILRCEITEAGETSTRFGFLWDTDDDAHDAVGYR